MDSWMGRVQTLAAGSLSASSLWSGPGSSLSCPLVQYSLLVPCGQGLALLVSDLPGLGLLLKAEDP